jgi:beta-lactamase regulating signal transducer with metallopeptidase domain
MIEHLTAMVSTSQSGRVGFAWTLLWQSTLWLAIGLLAGRIWRRRAGRAHLLVVLATSAAVISPLLTVTVRRMEWGVLAPSPVVISNAPDANAVPPAPPQEPVTGLPVDLQLDRPLDVAPEPVASRPVPRAAEMPVAMLEQTKNASPTESISPNSTTIAGLLPVVIAVIWITASLVLTIRLVLSLFAGGRIARNGREETNPRLLAALREAADALSLSSAPHLCVSSRVRCPMIWCWGARAVVLLPESTSEDAPIFWRSVFCHELAHLVRRDHWSALWAELVVILLPWQPLGWRCRRRLAFLREQACDDWVLAAGGTATEYAESLLQFVPQASPTHALAAVSSRESLKRRLEHVLSGVRIAPKVGRHWLAAATLLALAAIAGVGFAQQGRPVPAQVAEHAANVEVTKETKSSTPQEPPKTPVRTPTSDKPPAAALPRGVVALRGRVLLPNGQPAAGATVRAIKYSFKGREGTSVEVNVLAMLVADSRGMFQANLPIGPKKENGEPDVNLWATLPGYGLARHRLAPDETSGPIVINLADEEPIRGRILDLEGQPVRDARVEIIRYFDTTTPWVEQWLASARGITPGTTFFATAREETKPGRDEKDLRIKSAASVSEVVIPAVKTNAEGRFEIKGLGRDRLVDLAITGPRITTIGASVLTRPIKPLSFRYREISGSQFERVVAPSVPVEGVVADEETGKPIPGAVILHTAVSQGNGILGDDPSIGLLLSRTTDARGHYRLEGLGTSVTNYFQIMVPALPYPPVENLSLAASPSLKPIQHDIKLRHGVWAVGRAFDRTDGKAVSGMVYYTPFRANGFARNYERYRNQPTDFLANYPFGYVDAEGRFKIPVIPGRGVVCLKCTQGDYRPNLGRRDIKELAGSDKMSNPMRGATYERLLSEPFHAVREINVPVDARETHVDLPVDPGQSVVLNFTDEAGSPLSGLDTYGLRLDWRSIMDRNRAYVEGSSATLSASSPDETRTIWIRHRASGLFGLFHFTPKPGETARTMVLEPSAVVTGRLVTPEGAPVSGSEIEVVFAPNSADRLPGVKTDADGRFRQELPSGGPFELYAHPFPYAFFAEKLSVVAGERVELGEITIDRDQKNGPLQPKIHRGPEKRTRPHTEVSRTSLTLAGHVLNETGTPIPGASVSAIATSNANETGGVLKDRHEILGEATTDAAGAFRIEISGVSPKSHRYPLLIASSERYGLASQSFNLEGANTNAIFRLAKEQIIRGRFVDLQGQPAAHVSAHVAQIGLAPMVFLPPESWDGHAAAWPKSVTSDAQGRFAIHGVAANQAAYLGVDGDDRYAQQFLPLNGRRHEGVQTVTSLKPGEEAVVPLSPATVVAGIIRFADTKQPVPNARFTIYASQEKPPFGSFVGISGQADEQGRFRIVPYPGIYFQVTAYPPQGAPYLIRQSASEVKLGTSSAEINVDLPRGVLVRGKILEAGGDVPIANASIQYTPANKTSVRAGKDVITGWPGIALSGSDGNFAISVLPGLGHLLIHGPTRDYVYQEIGDRELADGRPGGRRNYAHAISRVEPPHDATSPIELSIKLKRVTAVSGRLLTPDGQPAEGALMISRLQINPISPSWRGSWVEIVRGGGFAISGCSPGVEYPVYFLDQEHQTGATARVENNSANPEPLTVRLAPCGSAKAHFVDSDGKPIEGLEPSLHLVVTPGASTFDLSPEARGQLAADEDFAANIDRKNQTPFPKSGPDGVATFRVLIPGATYELAGARNRQLTVLKQFSAEAGKTLDLGDVVADRPRER